MKTLIINYKAYAEGVDEGLLIANIAKEVSKKLRVKVIVSPPFTLLRETARICESISQGIDEIYPGAFTGHISWYEIKKSGAIGALLNHSEAKFKVFSALKKAVNLCKTHGLRTYVCVEDINEAKHVLKLAPTAIAYEPPELIGGDISVSTAKPEIVRKFCSLIERSGGILALIGAGIKNSEDVKRSLELGSDGVLVSSGIMKAKSFKKAILALGTPMSS
jgi:triosephosphate isomerase